MENIIIIISLYIIIMFLFFLEYRGKVNKILHFFFNKPIVKVFNNSGMKCVILPTQISASYKINLILKNNNS